MQRILFLAPQPFFEERGTPIAVRLLLEALAKPSEREFDLVTYASGSEVSIPGVTQHRIGRIFGVSRVRPGLSFSKLVADALMLLFVFMHLWRVGPRRYTHVHAVEEASFIALLVRWVTGLPYLYDMDSSLADQVVEKIPVLSFLHPVLRWFEGLALRQARLVIAVCPALVERASQAGAQRVELLTDVSLLEPIEPEIDLRRELGLAHAARIALYVGNLERYQGLDLLLEGWSEFERSGTASQSQIASQSQTASQHDWHLVIIGTGADGALTRYREFIAKNKLSRVHLAGPRPLKKLSSYLAAADLLTSPRLQGNNTPMKIYSYLHSGKAILATKLPTHTQVLNEENSFLFEPTPRACAQALGILCADQDMRTKLASSARKVADERYTVAAFQARAREIYLVT